MTLTLIETRNEKIAAQESLRASMENGWRHREMRVVVWRPDSREMDIFHNGEYWFAAAEPNPSDKTPRYWNPFGAYRESGNLKIAVEINSATESNSRRVSGFVARDIATGAVYLMHDGGVGGGTKGVGKGLFLAWAGLSPVPVVGSEGLSRLGVVVAQLGIGTTADWVARYVQQALDFKQTVKDGEVNSPQLREAGRTYKDYYDEFTGRKRRRSMREVEYVSRHGEIVGALCNWRSRSSANERIVKNAYIDLGVEANGKLIELYEVKTNSDRQTLYAAIGQILVHGVLVGAARLFLVLPDGDSIPEDVKAALRREAISLLRFEMTDDAVYIRS